MTCKTQSTVQTCEDREKNKAKSFFCKKIVLNIAFIHELYIKLLVKSEFVVSRKGPAGLKQPHGLKPRLVGWVVPEKNSCVIFLTVFSFFLYFTVLFLVLFDFKYIFPCHW